MTNQKKLFQSIQNITQVLNENKDLLTLLKQERLTLVSGVEDLEMDLEFKFGQMELDMKVKLKKFELFRPVER